MKILNCNWILLMTLLSASVAHGDIIFSKSNSDPGAGTNVSLGLGDVGSLFVWVSTNPGQTINGLSLDIISDVPSILEATNHIISNPSGRWSNVNSGILGDLVDDSNAFVLFGDGIATTGLTDFTLHSEVQFVATEIGTTELSFAEGSNLITDTVSSESIADSIEMGSGSVKVSVPEPGAFALLGLVGVFCAVGVSVIRMRRCHRTTHSDLPESGFICPDGEKDAFWTYLEPLTRNHRRQG